MLHSYKPDLPDILTQANKLVYDEIKGESKLVEQYYDWIFVKLRQIIGNYLSKDCPLTTAEKMKYYDSMIKQDSWENIMRNAKSVPREFKNKCVVFRSGFIILYFATRMMWRRNK